MNELLVNRLKNARNEKGLKQQEVAQQLGIKANTISNWEKGRTEPDIDTFVKLCEIYEIDCASLLSDVYAFKRIKSDVSFTEYEHIKKYRHLDSFGKEVVSYILDKELVRVQQLNDISHGRPSALRIYTYLNKIASAGTGFYFDDIPTDTIEAPYMEGADFIIGVSGDSMEPTYSDGDLVYVEKCQIVRTGEIGIFMVNNECLIKEAGENRLISHNQKYPNIPGSENVICVGRVLGKVVN